jgi:hypothetical protein
LFTGFRQRGASVVVVGGTSYGAVHIFEIFGFHVVLADELLMDFGSEGELVANTKGGLVTNTDGGLVTDTKGEMRRAG